MSLLILGGPLTIMEANWPLWGKNGKETGGRMASLQDLLMGFSDTLAGHLALVMYLMAVMEERSAGQRLKKLPVLLLSPLLATLLSVGLGRLPALGVSRYFIHCLAVFGMCALWTKWAWRTSFWQALAAVSMAGIFQVAAATLTFWLPLPFWPALALHLGISGVVALSLDRVGFGRWFRLWMEEAASPRRAALLLLGMEAAMEVFLFLAGGLSPVYLPAYYLAVATAAVLMAFLTVQLARGLETDRKLREALARRQRAPGEVFTLRTEDMVRHVPLEEILFFETAPLPHHVYLHTGGEQMEFLGSLNELEERLGDGFLRVHRAYLVAAEKIQGVDRKQGKLWVGGRECLVSRRGKTVLRERGI